MLSFCGDELNFDCIEVRGQIKKKCVSGRTTFLAILPCFDETIFCDPQLAGTIPSTVRCKNKQQ